MIYKHNVLRREGRSRTVTFSNHPRLSHFGTIRKGGLHKYTIHARVGASILMGHEGAKPEAVAARHSDRATSALRRQGHTQRSSSCLACDQNMIPFPFCVAFDFPFPYYHSRDANPRCKFATVHSYQRHSNTS